MITLLKAMYKAIVNGLTTMGNGFNADAENDTVVNRTKHR